MSLPARYASLLAFLESRDTQLSLPFADDCGREAGRFAQGNTCASDDGSGSGSVAAEQERPSRAPPNPVAGGPRANTANSFPGAWKQASPIHHQGGLPGIEQIAKMDVESPKAVRDRATAMGVKSVASLVRIGAADAAGAKVTISSRGSLRRDDGGGISVSVSSAIPIQSTDGSKIAGESIVVVQVRRDSPDDDPFVYYDLLSRGNDLTAEISLERNSGGESPIERKLGAMIFQQMIASLEEAEKSGLAKAKTYAAGSVQDTVFQGYRLWGRFGFDGNIPGSRAATLLADVDAALSSDPILSPEHARELRNTGTISLQKLLSTKNGEKWWKKKGGSINLSLDFRDKESIGYQRYKKMLDMSRRARDSGSRSYEDFCEFAISSGRDIAEWRGFAPTDLSLDCRIASLMAFAEARNCGTGSGGFQAGNTCAGGKIADAAEGAVKGAIKGAVIAAGTVAPLPPYVIKGAAIGAAVGAVKGLYDNSMQPTRIMKKIEKIGTTEKQVGDLVKRLGGSPKSLAKIKDGRLTLQVKNERGEKIFDVELGEKQYVITPSRKSGTLSSDEMAQVKKIADENSPKEVGVVVNAKSPSYVAKLVRKGFKVSANAAGDLIASVVVPIAASVAVGQVEGVVEGVSAVLKKKKT